MHERGPQAVKPMVDLFFQTCRDIVITNDGIVDHFLGDAVLAIFNVPIQRDNHVERAVRAAIAIQEVVPSINASLGEPDLLKVGIGISTGIAYTGVVGSTSCSDYTALGDAVNIASRLQSMAAPSEILLSKEAYDAVAASFPDAQERVLEIRGLPELIQAYSLTPHVATGGPRD